MGQIEPASRSRDGDRADPSAVRLAVARFEEALGVTAEVEIRETHISWLFLTRDRAFKLKKPLRLDFLDYGTPERRRIMCLEEVRLNARLAPDLYLGVRAVVGSSEGLRIVDADQPGAIDYLVEMRRYDEDQTLSALLARGEVDARTSANLGRALARFHAACSIVRRSQGAREVMSEIDENLQELVGRLATFEDRARPYLLDRFMRGFVCSHSEKLDKRAADGRVRECHGDLRAEHIVLGPALTIVDCVEFSAGLRRLDVADDLAFLVMDLAWLDAERFGRELLDGYRGAGGDCGEDALVYFYAVHRALVRAKVQLIRAGQQPPRSAAWEHATAAAMSFIALGERFAWGARGPLVLVICGVPASGKSHLAAALASISGLPVLSSDVVRKELAGLQAHEHGPVELYHSEFSRRTYSELGRRTALALNGAGILVDATFRRRDDRLAFNESFAAKAPLTFVECRAPAQIVSDRAAAREHDPARVSDATMEIVERERETWEPLDEVTPERHLALRTDRAVRSVIADLTALLDERMAGYAPT